MCSFGLHKTTHELHMYHSDDITLLLFDQTVEVDHSKDMALASHPHTSTTCYWCGSVLVQLYGKWGTLASHRWCKKYFNNSILGGLIYLHIQRLPAQTDTCSSGSKFRVLIMEFHKCVFLWECIDYKDKWTSTVRFSGTWVGHPFTVDSGVLSTCAYQNISRLMCLIIENYAPKHLCVAIVLAASLRWV